MTKAKVYPFINRHSGEVEIMTKRQGKELNEDWERPRVVKNDQGKKVFRFQLETPVTGDDGRVHNGTATIDISEMEAEDGNGQAE